MRVVDRRIRTIARAIDYPYRSFVGIHPGIETFRAVCERGLGRHLAVAAAVRVLAALDGDIIDQWTELVSDDIGFTTDRYVELPEDMQNTRRHGVQVTVRRMP